jgi:aspartate kinase
MGLIVQKYGGTSVGSVERIQAVARRVVNTVQAGHAVVVVVSAMGKTTDQLVKLAGQISANPSHREMDMLLSTGEQVSIALLSIALQELGQPAISMTGAQVGIVTEAAHTRARILHIQTERVDRRLKEGNVVVVAGFQGISSVDELEITTLGRGGSDTSAVAIAAALGAEACEIYTDVPGILTTDPRLVPDAQLMTEITADEMLELASLGAKVLHPRAVEIARNYGVTLVVRSSWTDDPGTRVVSPIPQPRSLQGLEIAHPVDGVELDANQAKVALLRVPDRPGIAARLFGEIALQNVDIDLIIQSIHEENTNDIAFTVNRQSLTRAEAVAEAIAPALRQNQANLSEAEVLIERHTAKISIAGAGMIGRPGVAAQMFTALAEANVNIQMISTSEVKVSCAIDTAECDRAVAALCRTFDIQASPVRLDGSAADRSSRSSDGSSEIENHSIHLLTDSDHPVRGAALDLKQARLAIRHVPDRPGMAACIFQPLAEQHISVDTIIQSQRCRLINGSPTRDIAFTVAQEDADAAQAILLNQVPELECHDIEVDRDIAKLSIVGIGMIGRPGVAARMFEALAYEGINIQMITTSEIKISCVVSETDGVRALQTIHQAFGLSGAQTMQMPA